jgi:ABC-type dipeptide/oligopeptide/nickel transport system permease subunit
MSVWQRLTHRPTAMAGLTVAALIVTAALLAPLLALHDPLAMPDPVGLRAAAPSAAHWLGTDIFSRDLLSRLLFGARVSLTVGIGAALLAALLGSAVGFAAGLGRPAVDAVLMRAVDVLLALPRLFLLLAVFALWEGVSLGIVILLIAGTGWFGTSRLVRAHVRQLRESAWARATLALGGGRARLARRMLPHVAATIIVSATLDIGNVILLEAGLSFLGLGMRPPTPTWGNMILEGRTLLFSAPWVAIAPGIALTLTVIAFNLLGDGLRDSLDPKAARRQDGKTAGAAA